MSAQLPSHNSHGGPRRNAGVKLGNLNALRHGRFSCFRDLVPFSAVMPIEIGRLVAPSPNEQANDQVLSTAVNSAVADLTSLSKPDARPIPQNDSIKSPHTRPTSHGRRSRTLLMRCNACNM